MVTPAASGLLPPEGDATCVDLRSDFLSRPTPEMIEAMAAAAGRRGGFGPRDDPEVRALEALAAEIVGKEDALFCPTCTLANQIAIHLACRPGSALVAESTAHVILSEAGGPAALSGAMCIGIPGHEGVPDADLLEQALSSGDTQRSRAALLVLENTNVRCGGAVIDLATSRRLQQAASGRGIPVHLDGSRIFNAATALDQPPSLLCSVADSVAFSLNKGLAAPLGAILAGSRTFIEEAVRVRQMFGGGWRPAGIVAAAARVGLESMPQRLAEDHAVASALGDALASLPMLSLAQSRVWTNLLLLDIDPRLGHAEAFASALERRGVRVLPFGRHRLRLATYYEIRPGHVPIVVAAFRDVISASAEPARSASALASARTRSGT